MVGAIADLSVLVHGMVGVIADLSAVISGAITAHAQAVWFAAQVSNARTALASRATRLFPRIPPNVSHSKAQQTATRRHTAMHAPAAKSAITALVLPAQITATLNAQVLNIRIIAARRATPARVIAAIHLTGRARPVRAALLTVTIKVVVPLMLTRVLVESHIQQIP